MITNIIARLAVSRMNFSCERENETGPYLLGPAPLARGYDKISVTFGKPGHSVKRGLVVDNA